MHFPIRSFLVALGVCLVAMAAAVAQDVGKADAPKRPRDSRPGVAFSHPSGFYDQPFALRLSHPERDAVIYYTLDGSDPDPGNVTGSVYR